MVMVWKMASEGLRGTVPLSLVLLVAVLFPEDRGALVLWSVMLRSARVLVIKGKLVSIISISITLIVVFVFWELSVFFVSWGIFLLSVFLVMAAILHWLFLYVSWRVFFQLIFPFVLAAKIYWPLFFLLVFKVTSGTCVAADPYRPRERWRVVEGSLSVRWVTEWL